MIAAFDAFAAQAQIDSLVGQNIVALGSLLDKFYPNAMIPTLFKNLSKCEDLAEKTRKMNSNPKI